MVGRRPPERLRAQPSARDVLVATLVLRSWWRLLMLTVVTAAAIRRPSRFAGKLPYYGCPFMNAERKRLVQQSWQSISRDHDRLVIAFYQRLFEIDPAAPALFAQTDMVAQRGKFLTMLGDIVRNLDMPQELIPTVSALGRRHVDYGVRDIDYDRVREALFAALAGEVGDRFTDELRDAWEEAYALTVSVMKRGAKTAPSHTTAS